MINCAAEQSLDGILATPSVAVLVSAEDTVVRDRIAGALADQSRLTVGVAASPHARMAAECLCDLLVFHCQTVESRELAVFVELRDRYADLRIVAVCESASGRSMRRAVDGAVDGVVFLADVETALVPTVAAVLAGQSAVPRRLRAGERGAALSFREKQILELVVMGRTNSEIATRLYLAESTVKSHLSSAFGKLGVRSRSEAAAVILDPQTSLGAIYPLRA